MDAGRLRRRDHGFRVRLWCSNRAMFCATVPENSSHVLRQIADMPAERRSPTTDRAPRRRADGSARRLPDADEGARKTRFAARARPDDAEPVALLEPEGDILDDDPLVAGRHDADAFDRKCRAGLGSASWFFSGGSRANSFVQAPPALPGRDEVAPVGDREIDRRQRARRDDRAGDDDAGASPPDRSPDRRRCRARPTAGAMRSTFETAPKPPPTSLARCCASRYLTFTSPHMAPIRGAMPIA